jgi:hypothetical protein
LTDDLNDLTGLPIDTELELVLISTEAEAPLLSLAAYRELGMNQNPEIQAAMETAEKRGKASESRRRTSFPMSAHSRSTRVAAGAFPESSPPASYP